MQHGSKVDEVQDILESSIAVLEGLKARAGFAKGDTTTVHGLPVGDVIANLRWAGELVETFRSVERWREEDR